MSNFEYIIASLPYLTLDYKYEDGHKWESVIEEIKENLVFKVFKVFLDLKVKMELLVIKVLEVFKENLVLKEIKATEEKTVLMVKEVLWVQLVLEV